MIGYKCLEMSGLIWRENQGGLFPLSPPAAFSEVSDRQARKILASGRFLFVRWESNFDERVISPWWHIIKSGSCEISELSANTRSKVRRGLKVYDCLPADREVILGEGYKVYRQAFERYKTHESIYSEERFVSAIKALPDHAEFWIVREKASQSLVAFSDNYVEGDTCFYNTIWFDPGSLQKYSSYALFFEMNRHYLEMRGFKYVSDGARNLSHDTEIHDFLVAKFGFRKAYARLHVVYTPWLAAAVAMAYPFRRLIAAIPLPPFKKARILLAQEEIRRQCEELAF